MGGGNKSLSRMIIKTAENGIINDTLNMLIHQITTLSAFVREIDYTSLFKLAHPDISINYSLYNTLC